MTKAQELLRDLNDLEDAVDTIGQWLKMLVQIDNRQPYYTPDNIAALREHDRQRCLLLDQTVASFETMQQLFNGGAA